MNSYTYEKLHVWKVTRIEYWVLIGALLYAYRFFHGTFDTRMFSNVKLFIRGTFGAFCPLRPTINGNIFHVTGLLSFWAGNSPITSEIPAQRPVAWSFDVFFDLRQNKRLSKKSWGWWFETPSRSLWRHCDVILFLGPPCYQWLSLGSGIGLVLVS